MYKHLGALAVTGCCWKCGAEALPGHDGAEEASRRPSVMICCAARRRWHMASTRRKQHRRHGPADEIASRRRCRGGGARRGDVADDHREDRGRSGSSSIESGGASLAYPFCAGPLKVPLCRAYGSFCNLADAGVHLLVKVPRLRRPCGQTCGFLTSRGQNKDLNSRNSQTLNSRKPNSLKQRAATVASAYKKF